MVLKALKAMFSRLQMQIPLSAKDATLAKAMRDADHGLFNPPLDPVLRCAYEIEYARVEMMTTAI